MTLDRQRFQVIGVMPPGFTFPITSVPPELWTSMSMLRATSDGSTPMTEQRDNDFFRCVARLKPDVSIQQAQANIDTIVADWRRQYPDSKSNTGGKVLPEISAMVGNTRSALLMLCAMAGCVLLVAPLNAPNPPLSPPPSRA